MRIALAFIFAIFFVGALACGLLLGGPPVSVYKYGDPIIGIAAGLLFLASMTLIGLVLGAGSEGKKRSVWRLPLLCLVATFLAFAFGLAIFSSNMEDLTPQHTALNLRLRIYAAGMIVFGLFTALCLLLSYFLAKRHNDKLPPAS